MDVTKTLCVYADSRKIIYSDLCIYFLGSADGQTTFEGNQRSSRTDLRWTRRPQTHRDPVCDCRQTPQRHGTFRYAGNAAGDRLTQSENPARARDGRG